MSKYFIYINQKTEGPFRVDELIAKRLKADTPVWNEGLKDWGRASSVRELKDAIDVEPPPFVRLTAGKYLTLKRTAVLVLSLIILCVGVAVGMHYKEIHDLKREFRNSPEKYVSVSVEDINANLLFGGVSDLKLRIRNSSPFFVTQIKIEVTYVRLDGRVYGRKEVDYSFLPGKTSYSIKGPSRNRGVQVKAKILSVKCQEAGL